MPTLETTTMGGVEASGVARNEFAWLRADATIPANRTYVVVNWPTALASNEYTVTWELPYQTSAWVTNKTTTQFVFNVGTRPTEDMPVRFFGLMEN